MQVVDNLDIENNYGNKTGKPTPENEAYANCPIEKQFHMKPYDMIHDSIKDYTELAQQFG